MKKHRRTLWPRLALALGTAILLVVALEGGARVFLGDRFVSGLPMGTPLEAIGMFDRDLGWVNKPGASSRVVAARFAYDVEINSKGLRDDEHEYEPPPGVTRIALLGDSLTWGWGVNNGETLADFLEARLAPGVEVINLSVPGYGTDQELWMLEREGIRYEPDLVLLCFLLNDILSNKETSTKGKGKPRYVKTDGKDWVLENHPVPEQWLKPAPGVGPLTWLYAHSAFLKMLHPEDPERDLAEHFRTDHLSPEQAEARQKTRDRRRAIFDAACDELKDPGSVHGMLLRRINDLCRKIDVPLVAFTVSHHHDQYLYLPDFPRPSEMESPYETYLTRCFREAGASIGFEVLSVDQAMLSAVDNGQTLTVGDGHLNVAGNEVVAGSLAPALERILAGRCR